MFSLVSQSLCLVVTKQRSLVSLGITSPRGNLHFKPFDRKRSRMGSLGLVLNHMLSCTSLLKTQQKREKAITGDGVQQYILCIAIQPPQS
jgi:hypothetical protein